MVGVVLAADGHAVADELAGRVLRDLLCEASGGGPRRAAAESSSERGGIVTHNKWAKEPEGVSETSCCC